MPYCYVKLGMLERLIESTGILPEDLKCQAYSFLR